MCFHLSEFHCPGCSRQFKPTFQRCPERMAGPHYTIASLTLVDLIRSNSYNCPYLDCELNGDRHIAVFDAQVDAASAGNSYIQDGNVFMPYDVFQPDLDDGEACDMALSDYEDADSDLAFIDPALLELCPIGPASESFLCKKVGEGSYDLRKTKSNPLRTDSGRFTADKHVSGKNLVSSRRVSKSSRANLLKRRGV